VPRAPRAFIEGGLYHVYNRVTRGERVFADDREAARLLGFLCETAERDGLVVLAWCIRPNHYHIVARTTCVPLWRTMATLQNRFSRSFNGRRQMFGPFWQGRYKAKLVPGSRYLQQLLLYVHLNPVAAGLVNDPAEHQWCGHREVLDRRRKGLVDVEELLLVFGTRKESAKRAYLAAMAVGASEDWVTEAPGWLPWWRLGRPPQDDGDEIAVAPDRPFVDELGRSTGRERQRLDAAALVRKVSERLGVTVESLSGRGKERRVVLARELAATLAVERYDLRVRDLAKATGARYDTVSRWGRRGAQRRSVDPTFREYLDKLDAELSACNPEGEGTTASGVQSTNGSNDGGPARKWPNARTWHVYAHPLALARALGLPLWSNDRDLWGHGVECYPTARLLQELERR
jgi:putative transposase